MSVKESVQSRLVREGRGWYLYISNQFAALMGAVVGVLVANQAIILPFLSDLPKPWNGIASGLLVTIPPIILRMWRQPKLQAKVCPEDTP